MAAPTPNLDDFQAAQERLMDQQGTPIVLLWPLPTVWPAGTAVDPESGKPRDPWVQPVASGWGSAACSGAVAYRVAYRRFEERADAAARRQQQPGTIIIRDSDYQAFGSAATRAIVNGEPVEIEKWVPDGPGRVMRWLAPIEEWT